MPIRCLLKEGISHSGKWGQDGESGALRTPFLTRFLCMDRVVEPEVLSHLVDCPVTQDQGGRSCL